MSSRKIRICYVLNNFELGGAETVALDLARGHDPEVFDVEVLSAMEPRSAKEPEMRRRFREAGVRTAAIYQDNLRSIPALFRLFRYLRRGRFDIVHGHNRSSDYWAVKLGALAGIPHRFWTRHLVYQDMSRKQIGRYKSVIGKTDQVIAVSDAVRRACLETEKLPADKVTTVPNGIDTEKFKPLPFAERLAVRSELGHDESERLLLFVGRLSDQKAPESFVELIWKLREAGLAVRGYLCGRGPLESRLRDMTAAGPGGVEILGVRSDIPRLLGACDLFVSTSRNEGLPLNVMEAMSAGAPLVAPAIPMIQELVKDSPLLQVRLTEPPPAEGPISDALVSQWALQVTEALGDDDLAKRSAEAGRTIIRERFSVARMLKAYERFFLETCAEEGASG